MAAETEILFVQGGGKGTHDDWDAKLVASLRRELGKGYEVSYPRLPNEDEPSYASWKPALEKALLKLDPGAVVVAHSVGATVLLKVLSEQTEASDLGALILIAPPFVGEGGWPADEFEFPPDLAARLPSGLAIHIFHGSEDDTVPGSHIEAYAGLIPQAHVHRLAGRDHQLNDDMSEVADVARHRSTARLVHSSAGS